MVEPTIGISDALGSLSESRPPPSSRDYENGLASAAASLERVTGTLGGMQAMFASTGAQMQQLTMAVQQQTQMLSSAIRQLDTTARMQTMSSTSAASVAATALRGAAPVNMPATLSQPMIPNGFFAPGPGRMVGSVASGNVMHGLRGSFGIGAPRSRVGALDSMNMFGESLGSRAMGATAGAAAMIPGLIAGMIPSTSGMATLGGMAGGALGGTAGGFFGSVAGGALSGGLGGAAIAGTVAAIPLAVAAAVQQTMGQISDIRGSGEMYANNAFRVGAGGMGRTSFGSRAAFGSDMLRAANSDLAYSTADMQELFASGISQDLMRGVSGARMAAARVRELAQTSKTIGRTLGLGIRDAMTLQSDLQDLGVTNMGSAMAGLRTTGLARNEALGLQRQFGGRFGGLQGAGLFGLGGASIEAGQTAIMRGALSAEELAAIGGRGGAQMLYGQSMVGMMQGGTGQLLRAASLGAGGFAGTGSGLAALNRAGQGATSANMLAMATGGNKMTREMLSSPQAQANILKTVSDMADQIGMGQDKQQVMQAILMSEFGMGEDDARGFLKIAAQMPESLRRRAALGAEEAASQVALQTIENFSPIGRAKRAVSGLTLGAAEWGASATASIGDMTTETLANWRNDIYGIRVRSAKTSDIADAVRRGIPSGGRSDVTAAMPSADKITKARNRIHNNFIASGNERFRSLVEDLRQETDPKERAKIADKLMSEVGYKESISTPDEVKAYEIALGDLINQNITAARSGSSVSIGDEEASIDSVRELQSMFSGLSREAVSTVSRDSDVQQYVLSAAKAGRLRQAGMFNRMTKEQQDELSVSETRMESILKSLYDKYGSDPKAINEIRKYIGSMEGSADPEKAAELFAALRRADTAQGRAAGGAAFQRAGVMSSDLLRGLGRGDLASTISAGGLFGAETALSKIRGDSKLLEQLRGAGSVGQSVATAAAITSGMSESDLDRVGALNDFSKQILEEGGGKLTAKGAERVRAYMFGSIGSVEGIEATSRAGFTEDQARAQAQMSAHVHETAALLSAVTEALKAMNIKVPSRGQNATNPGKVSAPGYMGMEPNVGG